MRIPKPLHLMWYSVLSIAWNIVALLLFVKSSMNVEGLIVLVVLSAACQESFTEVMYGRRWFGAFLYIGSVVFGYNLINVATLYSPASLIFVANAVLAALIFSVPLGYLLSIVVYFKSIFFILTDEYMVIKQLHDGNYVIVTMTGTYVASSSAGSFYTLDPCNALKEPDPEVLLKKGIALSINIMLE